MKSKTKIWRYLAAALLLGFLLAVNVKYYAFNSYYADLRFPAELKINRITIAETGSVLKIVEVGTVGQMLDVDILGRDINMPWTLYFPFYQFGTVSCRIFFDVRTSNGEWKGQYASITGDIDRYAMLPEFTLREQLEKSLLDLIVKNVEVRAKEALKHLAAEEKFMKK